MSKFIFTAHLNFHALIAHMFLHVGVVLVLSP